MKYSFTPSQSFEGHICHQNIWPTVRHKEDKSIDFSSMLTPRQRTTKKGYIALYQTHIYIYISNDWAYQKTLIMFPARLMSYQGPSTPLFPFLVRLGRYPELSVKSAHTALAVKACLLGGNSNTKCSMTFVNIAVAISALAGGGGAKNGFAPRSDPKNGFAPRPAYGGVCDFFRGFLGVWAQEGIEMEFWVILVAFRQWKNGQKWKKHCT